MSGREIVTLQLGHYANFTGAHWWNLQEASFVYDPKSKTLQSFPKEINHDVLFREGYICKGDVTFTPRLVALDLRGSLGTLRKEGTLYNEDKEEEVKWSEDVTLHKAFPESKNQFLQDMDKTESEEDEAHGKEVVCSTNQCMVEENKDKTESKQYVFGCKFYNLDNQVQVWSDFLRVHLHPRSVQLVQDFVLNSEEHFDVFGLGQQVLNGQAWDEYEDRVRFFVEECDLMQGFHVMFDSNNSFGGVADKVISYLKDEFSGKVVLTLPLSPAVLPDQTAVQRATRILNNALCVGGACCSSSSLYVPLSLASSLWRNLGAPRNFPHLIYNADLHYHTSAILAASLDTVTLPFRRQSSPAHLSEVTSALSSLGRKIASMSSCLPFPLLEQGTFIDTLMDKSKDLLCHSLTPHTRGQSDPTAQACVIRGVPLDRVERKNVTSACKLSRSSDIKDVLQQHLSERYPYSLNASYVMRDALKVGSPFPHIFHPSISKTGLISTTLRYPSSGVDSVPVMASLQSSPTVRDFVSSLYSAAAGFKIRRHHQFLEAGLEEEAFLEALNTLQSLADSYSILPSVT